MSTQQKDLTSPTPKGGKPGGHAVYEGTLQGVGDGTVLGWARDAAHPDVRVQVAIVVDDEIVLEGVADQARDDLAKEGIGDGQHGYQLTLPEALLDRAHHIIGVLVGPERVFISPAASFWVETRQDSPWSAVEFEPAKAPPVKTAAIPQPASVRTLLGRDGWLYDAADLTVCEPVDDAAIDRVARALTDLTRQFADIGIPYVPAIVPSKLHAVPYAAPDGLDLSRPWFEALSIRMLDEDAANVLDLMPAVRATQQRGASHHRSDPDWSDLCAFYVARALTKAARSYVPTLEVPGLADLHLRSLSGHRGRLADAQTAALVGSDLIDQETEVQDEDVLVIDPRHLHALRMPVELHLASDPTVHVRLFTQSQMSEDVRVAVLGEDAGLSVLPWLAECARRTVLFWAQRPPMEALELEMPHVVFHLIHERDLPGYAAT